MSTRWTVFHPRVRLSQCAITLENVLKRNPALPGLPRDVTASFTEEIWPKFWKAVLWAIAVVEGLSKYGPPRPDRGQYQDNYGYADDKRVSCD